MSDEQTIQVYDNRADDYAQKTSDFTVKDTQLKAFISGCTPGGRVLDLGCGPGLAAAVMAKAGLRVDATDASAEMIALVAPHPNVSARQETFEQISGDGVYDGVWASFSLLHATRTAFPHHLLALHKSLKPNGLFYIGMKLGDGEARDTIGRHYTYYTADGLSAALNTAGFRITGHLLGRGPGLDGVDSDWIAVAARA
jgi:SAM-dependent methyltransferase